MELLASLIGAVIGLVGSLEVARRSAVQTAKLTWATQSLEKAHSMKAQIESFRDQIYKESGAHSDLDGFFDHHDAEKIVRGWMLNIQTFDFDAMRPQRIEALIRLNTENYSYWGAANKKYASDLILEEIDHVVSNLYSMMEINRTPLWPGYMARLAQPNARTL